MMHKRNSQLPFPALVGLDVARQALLLLAVEPQLRGVVLVASVGTGKSSLARGLRDLLGPTAGPFVELPLGADEESLLGGLDLEATLRLGRRTLRPGLLARAHNGFMYVDGLGLLPDRSANLLLGALETGELRLEREGLSARVPARFGLIGSYDPAEGVPRRHLLDRIGLLVTLPAHKALEERSLVLHQHLRASADEWDLEVELLRGMLQAAREALPAVQISERQIEWLTRAALHFGVEGQRVDLFALRAACASAALALRDAVSDEDLQLALRLVIIPRATRIPERQDAPPEEPPPPEPPEQSEDDGQNQDEPPPSQTPEPLADQVFEALISEAPLDLQRLPFHALRRGRAGSRGETSGKRGRHIRSLPGDPRRQRIDVSATLRAAAPWQRVRQIIPGPGRPAGQRRVWLSIDDLRVKQFQSKAGALFCFAVDASGSMALHRMRQAKGAIHALLQQAYVHRDRVALLSFRGQQADLLLPPSQSVELARRALDLLPTGGGTPVAAALLAALDVYRQARARGIMQMVLILLTDGRANIGLRVPREQVAEELSTAAAYVAQSGIRSIVVDTQRSYLSRGEARRLAEWLHGDYIYLPNASGEQIASLALDSRG